MSDFNITVPLSDYEEKTRDQIRVEILSELLQADIYVSDSILKIVCGLQVEKKKASCEPAIMVEKIEDVIPMDCTSSKEADGTERVILVSVQNAEPILIQEKNAPVRKKHRIRPYFRGTKKIMILRKD